MSAGRVKVQSCSQKGPQVGACKRLLSYAALGCLSFVLSWKLFWERTEVPFQPYLSADTSKVPGKDPQVVASCIQEFQRILAEGPPSFDVSTPSLVDTTLDPRDEEWANLPRTNQPPLPAYLNNCSPHDFPVSRLFRNRTLNAQDAYIPKGHRTSLEALLRSHMEAIANVDRVYYEVFAQEARALIILGRVAPLNYNSNESTLRKLSREGARNTIYTDPSMYENGETIDEFHYTGGALYGLSYDQMPSVKPIVDYRRFLRNSCAIAIGQWFCSSGLLSERDFSIYASKLTY